MSTAGSESGSEPPAASSDSSWMAAGVKALRALCAGFSGLQIDKGCRPTHLDRIVWVPDTPVPMPQHKYPPTDYLSVPADPLDGHGRRIRRCTWTHYTVRQLLHIAWYILRQYYPEQWKEYKRLLRAYLLVEEA